MQIEEGFYSHNIWKAIQVISESSLPKKVASAYIGEGVLFNWTSHDILIIGLSESNVRKGFVNPTTLEQLLDKGVKIYKAETLHAKIYANSEAAVVCSCNLSKASQDIWTEAGIFSTNEKVKEKITHFFEEHTKTENLVTKNHLNELKNIFNTSTINIEPASEDKETTYKLWAFTLSQGSPEDRETQDKINESQKEILSYIDNNTFSYYNFKTNNTELCNIKKDDFVIISKLINENLNIYFPYKCKAVTKIIDNLHLVHLFQKKGINPIPWNSISNEFLNYGLQPNGYEIKENKQKILDKLSFTFLNK